MSEGLRANSVFATFSVRTDEWSKGINKAIKDVVGFSKRVEEVGSKLGGFGAVMAASIGGAVAVAAKASEPLNAQVQRISDLMTTMAVEVGEAFLPTVQAIADAIGKAVAAFQAMDPALKKQIAGVASWVTGGLLAVGALGKLSGAFAAVVQGGSMVASGLSSAFSVVGAIVGGISAPVLAVGAAIAGLVLLAGALYKAWNDSSTGLRDSVMGIVDSIKAWGAGVADFFRDLFAGVRDFFVRMAKNYLDLVAANIRALAKMLKPVADFLGMDGASKFLADAESLTGDKLLEGLKTGAEMLVQGAKTAADVVVDGVKYSLSGVKQAGADLLSGAAPMLERLKNALGLNAQNDPKVRTGKHKEQELGTAAALNASAFAERAGQDASLVGAMGRRMVEEARATAEAFAQAVRDARANLVSRFKSAFGQVSSLVDTFQEGMLAGAGSPLAGVAAVVGELFVQSAQFSQLMEMVSRFLALVADTVGAVLAPVLPVVGAALGAVGELLQALAPVIAMTLEPVGMLAPVFALLAQTLQALAPVITLAGQLFILVTQPMRLLAGPAMRGLFEAVKVVAGGILWVARAIGGVWNGIVGAVQSVLRSLGNISIFGAKPLGFLNGWADSLQGAMVDTDALTDAMNTLQSTTWEQAQAAAEATVEQSNMAAAARKATESLSNVPSVFKYTLRAFEAADAVSLAPSPSVAGGVGKGGTVINDNSTITIVVEGGTADADKIAEQVQAKLEKAQRRRYGTGERLGARYG